MSCQPVDFRAVDHWLCPRLPLWPCELCGAPAGVEGICAPCRAELPWISAACQLCARPLSAPGRCGACLRDPPPWSRAIAPLAWRFPVEALIGRFKYDGALQLGAVLGRLLATRCAVVPRPDAIVPVPLHRSRQAERGFNQAQELARPVAAALALPVLARGSLRVVPAPAQAGLAARQRYRNLAGAFRADETVSGCRIAILDDVLTTGSTARALAQELLRAGATAVQVWAVARGGTAQGGVNV